jgi:Small primase-like proteins (Toprim domain)
MEKLSFAQTIIVEGKYDKQKLSEFISSSIITTNGFRIFNDKAKRNMIKSLANTQGILVLSDSDHAGQKIRNYIKGFCGEGAKIVNVYCPQIRGIERRKDAPSAEEILGVEGLSADILKECFARACVEQSDSADVYTKSDLYDIGLAGKPDSKQRRAELLRRHGFPEYLSAGDLLNLMNSGSIEISNLSSQ